MKPDCILDYNAHMCGVDRLDQMLSYYSPLRKTLKWYRKVVLQALDMALSNGFVLYKQAGGNQLQIWFRTQVIQSLLASQERLAEPSVAPRALVHHKASDLSSLQGQHYMDVIPPTGKKAAPTTKCVMCNKHGRRWGFTSPADRQRIEVFIRRAARSGFYSADSQTAAELVSDSDDNLFRNVINNENHVLYKLLPERTAHYYNLRQKRHGLTLHVYELRLS